MLFTFHISQSKTNARKIVNVTNLRTQSFSTNLIVTTIAKAKQKGKLNSNHNLTIQVYTDVPARMDHTDLSIKTNLIRWKLTKSYHT